MFFKIFNKFKNNKEYIDFLALNKIDQKFYIQELCRLIMSKRYFNLIHNTLDSKDCSFNVFNQNSFIERTNNYFDINQKNIALISNIWNKERLLDKPGSEIKEIIKTNGFIFQKNNHTGIFIEDLDILIINNGNHSMFISDRFSLINISSSELKKNIFFYKISDSFKETIFNNKYITFKKSIVKINNDLITKLLICIYLYKFNELPRFEK